MVWSKDYNRSGSVDPFISLSYLMLNIVLSINDKYVGWLIVDCQGKSLFQCRVMDNCSLIATIFLLLVTVTTVKQNNLRLSLSRATAGESADLCDWQHSPPAGGCWSGFPQNHQKWSAVCCFRNLHNLVTKPSLIISPPEIHSFFSGSQASP